MDTGLPKISAVEFDTGPTYPPPTTPINDFKQPLTNVIIKYKCKYLLPCGLCELTKDMCNYEHR